ncbi:MAG: hypothetical protein J0H98_04245 [Solirubrobacterales bacterium]|nr:hypothetical protein [Solirubrobacterales bacterium]
MSTRAQTYGGTRRPPRRRPAPRRNAGQPGAGRIQWDRFGRVVLVIVIGLLVLAMIKPAWNMLHTYRLAGQSKVRLHEAQAENAMLERRVKRARSDAMLSREARRQGMILPDEQAWVVNGIK